MERFNARAGDGLSGERLEPSAGGNDSGWCERLIWLAHGGLKPKPERNTALQPSQNWGKIAASGAQCEGTGGAPRLSCQRWIVAGVPFTVTVEVSANFYVTPGSHLHVQYTATRKKLLRMAVVMVNLEVRPNPVSVGLEYVQHTGSK